MSFKFLIFLNIITIYTSLNIQQNKILIIVLKAYNTFKPVKRLINVVGRHGRPALNALLCAIPLEQTKKINEKHTFELDLHKNAWFKTIKSFFLLNN